MNDVKAIKILENINKGYVDFNYRKDSIEAIDELKELQAIIEAQEIIIKDKTAIMEAMAQPKTCEWCIYKEYSPMHNNCNKAGTDDGWSCSTFYSKMPDYYEPKAQP